MAASQSYLDHLQELLAPLGPIAIKRMFSGAGIYLDGVMFALVADDVLYLKASAATKARFEDEGLKPFTYEGKSKPVAMSYWRAPERLLDEHDEMLDWAREAVRVAQASKVSKRKTPRRR